MYWVIELCMTLHLTNVAAFYLLERLVSFINCEAWLVTIAQQLVSLTVRNHVFAL